MSAVNERGPFRQRTVDRREYGNRLRTASDTVTSTDSGPEQPGALLYDRYPTTSAITEGRPPGQTGGLLSGALGSRHRRGTLNPGKALRRSDEARPGQPGRTDPAGRSAASGARTGPTDTRGRGDVSSGRQRSRTVQPSSGGISGSAAVNRWLAEAFGADGDTPQNAFRADTNGASTTGVVGGASSNAALKLVGAVVAVVFGLVAFAGVFLSGVEDPRADLGNPWRDGGFDEAMINNLPVRVEESMAPAASVSVNADHARLLVVTADDVQGVRVRSATDGTDCLMPRTHVTTTGQQPRVLVMIPCDVAESVWVVEVPIGTDLIASSSDGGVQAQGDFGTVNLSGTDADVVFGGTATGDRANAANLRSSTGAVHFEGSATGADGSTVGLFTDSGQITGTVDTAPVLVADTKSGDVEIDLSAEVDRVNVSSESGNLNLTGSFENRGIRASSDTGVVDLGTAVNDEDAPYDRTLSVRSNSGDVRLN